MQRCQIGIAGHAAKHWDRKTSWSASSPTSSATIVDKISDDANPFIDAGHNCGTRFAQGDSAGNLPERTWRTESVVAIFSTASH
jgi:hypothetical protein